MAIAPTGTIYKSLVFDGESSRDYGIYITGAAVYNAPERDVEMVSIPGRNGSFALDKGRFENIEVTYPAGVFAQNEADFAQAVSDLRNYLCSRHGYCRLVDEYNPAEYRLAIYKSGLEVDPFRLEAGEFNITFDCKPQRYLLSGEEPITIGEWSNTRTASGTIASFEAVEGDGVKSLVVDIEPIQSGSGTPGPDNVRPISGYGSVVVSRTQVNVWDEEWEVGAYSGATGEKSTSSAGRIRSKNHIAVIPNTAYYATTLVDAVCFYDAEKNYLNNYTDAVRPFTTPSNCGYITFYSKTNYGTTYNHDISINYPSTDHDYHAYNGNTYTTDLSGTRYGGTLDVVSGILTVDTLKLTFDGTEDWRAYNGFYYVATGKSGGNPQEMLCNAFDWKGIQTPATPQIGDFWAGYTSGGVWTGNICFKYDDGSNLNAFKTYIASIPLEVTYKIEPVTYEVSQPMSYIQLATGTNNFWADTGDITVEYGTIPYTVYNPTLFEARPMLEVEGHGNININGETITLNDAEVGNTAIADASVQNWPTSTSYTYTFDIDVSMLNEGDIITVPQVALEYSYAINDGYTNVRASIDTPHNATGATNASGTTQKITLDAGSFAYKTAGSYDGSVWFDVSWNSPNADSDELQRMARVSYDGEHTITLVSVGSNADEECYTRTGTKWIIPTIYGKSTKMISSVVDKAYIDLDVGEAYFVDDGTVVSLNNVATLPAELPTLKAGANEITFGNTVTDLKVVPRWWKV